MSTFLSGAAVDCGPSNVLKNVGGRLDRDFSLHQDRLISTPNVAGPSSRPFSATVRGPPPQQVIGPQPTPFDLSSLQKHLVPPPIAQRAVDQGWANSFIPQLNVPPTYQAPAQVQHPVQTQWQSEFLNQHHQPPPVSHAPQSTLRPAYQPPSQAQWAPSFAPAPPNSLFSPLPNPPLDAFPPLLTRDKHAAILETQPVAVPAPIQSIESAQPREPLTESQDLLAQTARSLLDQANSSRLLEEQPKLRESKFMALMQSLGRGDLVVQEDQSASEEREGEGAKLVHRALAKDWAGDFLGQSAGPAFNSTLGGTSLDQSQGRFPDDILDETSTPWTRDYLTQAGPSQATRSMQRSKSVHFDETAQGSVVAAEEELGFDEETFAHFNGAQSIARQSINGVGASEKWGDLQRDWEAFVQRGSTSEAGTKEEERYLFQSRNPYVDRGILVDPGRESPTIKGVLELEAAVQANPTNHQAWFALGLKQQENEREVAAITALRKVVTLEPGFRAAYLALAVSYTNEGDFRSANSMLEKWISLDPESAAIASTSGATGGTLVDRLIDMARLQPDEVDADVQVALGVLFNSSEEYEKAEDCFLSALSVRPNDWLLYNRLGATLANSGRSSEALEYYDRALELHPNFVRALFNLGISYINLAQYPLAAQRILDALRLQHADATEGYSSGSGGSVKGVTSDTLWNTLRNACLHMGRNHLVQLAAKKDLAGFPLDVASEQSLASP